MSATATALPAVLAVAATAALALGVAWRAGPMSARPVAPSSSAGGALDRDGGSAVVCPDCGTANALTSVYCVKCQSQLAPAWVEEW